MRTARLTLLVLLVTIVTNALGQVDSIVRQDTLREVYVSSQSAVQRVVTQQIGAEKVNVATMSRLPALMGERDVIKGLQLLPGVKGEGDGLGGYQVRGGTSAQNQILLDGAAVYNAGHLVGLFSAFNDDVMGGVDLYKGLVPARFGGGSSSVLTINTRTGDTQKHHFAGTAGLLSIKAEADGPVGKNGSSYLVAARTSLLNFYIKGSREYGGNSLSFYDVNAKLNFRLSDKDQLSFSLFRSFDLIEVESMMNMSWHNTAGSLSWNHTVNDQHLMTTQLVASEFYTDQGIDVFTVNYKLDGFNRQLTLRHQQTWTPKHHKLNVGGESTLIGLQSASWTVRRNLTEREKRDAWFSALWASDDLALCNNRLLISAGLRADFFAPLGGKPYYKLDDDGKIIETMYPRSGSIVKTYIYVQPRVSLLWQVGELASVKAGYSRLVQPIHPVRNSSIAMPLDRTTMVSNIVQPQVSDLLSAGFALMTRDGAYDFSVDAYWKKLQHVYDYRDGKTFNMEIEMERLLVEGRGRAYGLELAAHKNQGRMTGWLAYTLSKVENKIDGIMDGDWYVAAHDRRHDFVAVLMADIGKDWLLTTTWRYTTGQAMTAPAGKYEIDGETYYYYERRNDRRAPDYHRLDFSMAHTKHSSRMTRTWSFGVMNAYNRMNPFFVNFEEDDTKASGTKAVVTSLYGIVPFISLSIKY